MTVRVRGPDLRSGSESAWVLTGWPRARENACACIAQTGPSPDPVQVRIRLGMRTRERSLSTARATIPHLRLDRAPENARRPARRLPVEDIHPQRHRVA